MYRNVAFIGKARSGKDTAALRLVESWAFTRVAFADPLKRMALQVNPFIPTGPGIAVRLESLIADVGWGYAKDHYPEVRRILQCLGASVRELDPDFWLDIALRSIDAARTWNMPVVVTDCRYPNEAVKLRQFGFYMVEIRRRGANGNGHESETALSGFVADRVLCNDNGVFDLHTAVDTLVQSRI